MDCYRYCYYSCSHFGSATYCYCYCYCYCYRYCYCYCYTTPIAIATATATAAPTPTSVLAPCTTTAIATVPGVPLITVVRRESRLESFFKCFSIRRNSGKLF